MRALWFLDGCRSSQVHAVTLEKTPEPVLCSMPGKSCREPEPDTVSTDRQSISGLAEPTILPAYRPIDYVQTLATIYEEIEISQDSKRASLYLEQSFIFKGLGETKLVRRSLRSAKQHASTVHEKLVYAAWLKYEKRGEEVGDNVCTYEHKLDCSRDHCSCQKSFSEHLSKAEDGSFLKNDIVFYIDGEEVHCSRQKIASLSVPFHVMLNGSFVESRKMHINFSENGISASGMKAVSKFSKSDELECLSPNALLELLMFSNRFCCETLKDICDRRLSGLVHNLQDALEFMEYGLEERSPALACACLRIFLRELPQSLHNPAVASLLCRSDSRKKLVEVGHSSFALYCLLSQAAIEDNVKLDTTLLLLERLVDCAQSSRQRALAFHQVGCAMLTRMAYGDAQIFFERAAREGHIYSLAGVARSKYKQGHYRAAYDEITGLLSCFEPTGWMYQERSLYCRSNKERLADLNKATELDPTLSYPYKYRALVLMDEQKVHAAIAEINRILGFRVTTDCLELRVHFCIALKDYAAAVRDLRALLTLDQYYLLSSSNVAAAQLLGLLIQQVDPWTKADCWMQLYDRWSSVDDIGSLAVVHQMLESDPRKGLLFFRQSLLLLRLNCPKAAMRSLRLAREHANSEHESLVYEGWILYDTGHREEALRKAEESIRIQRSFEAFFLKAYALADTTLDFASSAKVIELLEEALKCPSDGLRKGQAWNNLGSVFVDCNKYDQAANCYTNALKIRHTRAHQGLARVYNLQGNRKEAYDEMTKLIEKARNNASAYEKRSEYAERDMTLADLSMVSQLDPLRTYPYRYRAAVLMDSHKEDEAIAELSKAIKFKADLQLLHLRAAFYDCIGDLQAALRDCCAALAMDPHHTDTSELHKRISRHLQDSTV